MRQMHDKAYRRLFKNKGIFRQLLETFVKQAWVKELDFKTCETLDKSFVADHYKESISDVIHKIKLRQQDLFIVILTEFKSNVERFTSLDVAHYVVSFYKDYVESNKNVRILPPVFPILLYNGGAKWTAPTQLSDLIEGSGYLGEYSLNFAYYKIAIEVREMLITALEKEKRELTAKVTAKVTAKAKREQQTEIARKMLAKGLKLPLVAEVTGLSEKTIRQLKQEMEN